MQLVFVYRKSLMASQRSSSQKTFPKVGLLQVSVIFRYIRFFNVHLLGLLDRHNLEFYNLLIG